jgi:tRNA(Ile)-lysidine synthase
MLADFIRRFLAAHAPDVRRVVAAVSGGGDSTALLLALSELRDDVTVVAAHVNHHLRGQESDGDESFVRDLCAQLGIELHVHDGTLDPERVRSDGIEAAARHVREMRLQEVRQRTACDVIATAHQQNDQAETVMMRLLTGGGAAAMRGIHPLRADGFIRPLLEVSRQEICAYLQAFGITPRHDRSNDDPRFLRNRVRALLRGSAPAPLARVAAQARAQWRVLEAAVDAAEDVEMSEEMTMFRSLPDDAWLRQALLHRHIVRLDPAHARNVGAQDLERLAQTRKRTSVTKSLELLPREGTLILRLKPQPTDPFELPLTIDHPAVIETVQTTITIERTMNNGPRSTGQPITLPKGTTPQFTVRNRRPGDRFHPLGYPSPTKLKDFLINRRIPREQRDRIPLVLWRGEIIWVAGVAVSETVRNGGEGDVYLLHEYNRGSERGSIR